MTKRRYDRVLTIDGEDLGLMLAKDQNGRPMWNVIPSPGLAPTYNPGQASYLNYSPIDDLVFEESDWREGLSSGGYGGDDRFKGRIFAPPKLNTLANVPPTLSITNPGFETGDFTGWTQTSIDGTWTFAVVTSPVQEGTKAVDMFLPSMTGEAKLTQALSSPSFYDNKTVTITVWARRSSTNVSMQLRLNRNGGNVASDTITAGADTWEQLSVEYSVPSGTTSLEIELYASSTAFGLHAYWDTVEGTGTIPITNPGFEDGDFTGWTTTAIAYTPTFDVSAGYQKEGTYGARIYLDVEAEAGKIHQSIANASSYIGKTITITVWANRGTDGTTGTLRLNRNGSLVASDSITAAQTVWEQLSVNYVVPSGTTSLEIELYGILVSGTATYTYWDVIAPTFEPMSITNAGFEDADLTGWTQTDTVGIHTFQVVETPVHDGSYAADVSLTSARAKLTQAISDPENYINHTLSLTSWARRDSTNASIELRLNRNGSLATSDVISVGADTWEQLSLSYVVPCGTTSLEIELYVSVTAFNVHSYHDLVEESISDMGTAVDYIVFKGDLYLACSDALYKIESGAWVAKFASGDTITCVGTLGDSYILVGFGSGTKYYYSTDGDSWTQSALSDGYADHFAWVIAGGGETLWKALGRQIKSSTDPSNGGSWTGATNIGWLTTNIINLLSYREELYVFKEEGLYIYDGANWVPLSRELESLVSTSSGKNPYGWKNVVYFPMGANAIYYYAPSDAILATITPSKYAPSEAAFRGGCQALAADEEFLFAFLNEGAEIEVLSGRWEAIEDLGTDFRWHPLLSFTSSDIATALVTPVVTEKRLWFAGGNGNNIPKYLILPEKYGDIPSVSGYKFDTGWKHYTPTFTGYFIDIPKVWASFTLKTESLLLGTRTILVEYSVDDGGWTEIGIFDTSPLQTLYIGHNGVEGKEIRLAFTGTNGEDVTPIIKGFALHGLLRPEAKKEFQFSVLVGDNLSTRDGQADRSQTGQQIATRLREAYRTLPIELTDEWGQVHKVVLITPPTESLVLDEVNRNEQNVFTLTCRGVPFG